MIVPKYGFQRLRFDPIACVGAVMMMMATLASALVSAQPAPPNGPRPNLSRTHVLTHVRVVEKPGVVIDDATVVIRDGVIDSVGKDIAIPPGARVWDLPGKTVHAGFIDLSVSVDIPAGWLGDSPGRHWNGKVHPEVESASLPGVTKSDRDQLRKIGFTAALTAPGSGIFRGISDLVNLADRADEPRVYVEHGPMVTDFETGGWRSNEYPGSLMGALALMRQTFLDAGWYRASAEVYSNDPEGLRAPEAADALRALGPYLKPNGLTPQNQVILRARDELDILRCAGLADEFALDAIIKGSGKEFRRLDEVTAKGLPMIVPIAFVEPPSIESLDDAEGVTLRDLMEWEQEPTNVKRLIESGVPVALTSEGSKSADGFMKNLRLAMKEGLTEDEALASLTTVPAEMIDVDDVMGTVEAGKVANLVVIDGVGELFGKDREVESVWVDGTRYELKAEPIVDARGDWTVSSVSGGGGGGGGVGGGGGGEVATPIAVGAMIEIEGKRASKPSVKFGGKVDENEGDDAVEDEGATEKEEHGVVAKRVSVRGSRITAVVSGESFGRDGWDRVAMVIDGPTMHGAWEAASTGEVVRWNATRVSDEEEEDGDDGSRGEGDESKKEDDFVPAPAAYPVPLGAFGRMGEPFSPDVIFIHNGTVWTGTKDGVIENGDVVIRDGKVVAIGQGLTPPDGAYTIDATGKHVTAGLVDAHSHTGISRGSINEGTQAITAEVRIQDVINPDDINWYRELAGGLTVVNQLHGSANPIGGQNSVVKIKWGYGAEAFKFEGAIPGIKFALGENVKQSNWGDDQTTRYPQTRMGVEAIMRSAFDAAIDYRKAFKDYENLSDDEKARTYPPKRDLELDTLVEVLEGNRIVHCHSYRQNEILMLIRLAEDYGFTIGTFQHVLEGYKVAKELAEHGAGGSCFSDWWSYKFEVYDAIPYDGAIMHDVGVVTSFNSDSNELARRMNLEAAKAVKYGNIAPEEALNFVAFNPANQLRIDDRVGSIEVGKDADFVIWSGDPLSTFTKCEQTWIDGERMFSLEEDAEMRAFAKAERSRITQKILRMNLGKVESKQGEGEDEDDESGLTKSVPGVSGLTKAHWFGTGQWLAEMAHERESQMMAQGVCGLDYSETSAGHSH